MGTPKIRINFTQNTLVQKRIFYGEATINKEDGKFVISGSALKGSGMAFKTIYMICGLATFLVVSFLLIYFFTKSEFIVHTSYSYSNPGHMLSDLLFMCLSLVGGYYASKALCKYILREKISEELSVNGVTAIIKEEELEESQGKNAPPIMKQYIMIKMKDSKNGIRFTCLQEDVHKLPLLLSVPIEE